MTGFTRKFAKKDAAEKAAQAIYGVEAVANDIEVKLVSTGTAPEIARDIGRAVRLDLIVPDETIQVRVNGGFVRLEGTLGWDFERRCTAACARHVRGVRGVINNRGTSIRSDRKMGAASDCPSGALCWVTKIALISGEKIKRQRDCDTTASDWLRPSSSGGSRNRNLQSYPERRGRGAERQAEQASECGSCAGE